MQIIINQREIIRYKINCGSIQIGSSFWLPKSRV